MDRIRITDLRCRAHVGVTPEERESPQDLRLDLEVELDLEAAVHSDRLVHTIDYVSLVESVQEMLLSQPFHLLETAAHRVCSLVLQEGRIESVRVVLSKRPAILAGRVGSVEVEMQRGR